MALDVDGWRSVADLTAGTAATALGLFLLLAGQRSVSNRLLAVLMLLLGLSFLAPGIGLFLTTRASDYQRAVYGWASSAAFALVYLAFVGSALRTPLARPLGRPAARALLLGLAALVSVGLVVAHRALFFERPDGTFDILPAVAALINLGTVPLLAYALACAIQGHLRARPGSAARDTARRYLVAFALNDAGLILYLVSTSVDVGPFVDHFFYFLSAATLLASALLVGRALLLGQLFDLDLRLRSTLRRGTLVGIFVAAFFIAFSIAEQYLQRYGVLVGGAAVGLLLLAARPIERAADRFANTAMPHVQDTAEYRTVRKREVYRAAIESALEDGDVTDRERSVLATLADQLGLGVKETLEIEREARGHGPAGASRA